MIKTKKLGVGGKFTIDNCIAIIFHCEKLKVFSLRSEMWQRCSPFS